MAKSAPHALLDYVEDWLDDELRDYVYRKFDPAEDVKHLHEFIAANSAAELDETWWSKQLANYYHRAKILGLENANGRQALGKFVATAIGMLAAAVDEFGELPEPGVSSGDNLNNLRSING